MMDGGFCLFILLGILLFVTASDKFCLFCFVLSKDCWVAANSQETAFAQGKTHNSTKAVHELHKIKLHVACRLQCFPLKAGALIWSCPCMFVVQKKVCIRLIRDVLTVTMLFLGFGSSPAP